MDFSILYAIQSIRTPALDSFWLFITNLAGSYGQLWIIAGVLMCIFKKTRRWGFSVLLSYALVFLFGQMALKDLIARPRPCHIDQTVQLLVNRPDSYSCPSTHSAWAFACASSLFVYNKKIGVPVLILAALISFSRLYLFVHFPTDVLFGVALGVIFGVAAALLVRRIPSSKKKTA